MTVTTRRVTGERPVRQPSAIVCRSAGAQGNTIAAPTPLGPPAGTSNGGWRGAYMRFSGGIGSGRFNHQLSLAFDREPRSRLSCDQTIVPYVWCGR